MTSTFATTSNASCTPVHGGVRVRALAVALLMQVGIFTPPRSPGPGRP